MKKKIVRITGFALAALMLVAMIPMLLPKTALPAEAATTAPTYVVDFSQPTNSPTETFGFHGGHNVRLAPNTYDGYMTFEATGSDPYLFVTVEGAGTNTMGWMVIKYRSNQAGNYEIFSHNPDGADYRTGTWNNTSNQWAYAVVNVSTWKFCSGASGYTTPRFRFDFLTTASGSLDVQYIAFYPTEAAAQASFNYTNITPTHSYDFSKYADYKEWVLSLHNIKPSADSKAGYLSFTASGTDPYMVFNNPNESISISQADHILIKYKNHSNTTNFRIMWMDAGLEFEHYHVLGSWNEKNNGYGNTAGVWSYALLDASAAWSLFANSRNMNSFRLDIFDDLGKDATNFSGQSIDIASIDFFAERVDALNYLEQDRTCIAITQTVGATPGSTTQTPGDRVNYDASKVLATNAGTYFYCEQGYAELTNITPSENFAEASTDINVDGAYLVPNGGTPWWLGITNGFPLSLGSAYSWVGFYGWIQNASSIVDVGYQINGNAPYWYEISSRPLVLSPFNFYSTNSGDGTWVNPLHNGQLTSEGETGSKITDALGNNDAKRFIIWVPVSNMNAGELNHIWLYAKKSNGSVISLNKGYSKYVTDERKITGGNNTSGSIVINLGSEDCTTYRKYIDGWNNVYYSKPNLVFTGSDGKEYVYKGSAIQVYYDDGQYYTGSYGSVSTAGSAALYQTTYKVNTEPIPWYKITFEANGGTFTGANTCMYRNNQTSITLPTPTRSGFNFAGWLATTSGNGWPTTSLPGGSFNCSGKSGDVTLQAQWDPIGYTITYDGNDGTYTDGDATYTPEGKISLPQKITRPGYIFSGWKVTENSEKTWTVGETFTYNHGQQQWISKDNKSLANSHGRYGNVTLEALWTALEYTITYEYDYYLGGRLEGDNYNTDYKTNATIVFPTASKPGYTFKGWKVVDNVNTSWIKDSSFSGTLESGNGKYGNVTLEAEWEALPADANNTQTNLATFCNADGTVYLSYGYDSSVGVQFPDLSAVPVPKGYQEESIEWYVVEAIDPTWFDQAPYTENGAGRENAASGVPGKYGHVTFQARWKPIEYTITFDYGYKANSSDANNIQEIVKFTVETIKDTPTVSIPVLQNLGHRFEGWSGAPGWLDTKQGVITLNDDRLGDITLTAQWHLFEAEITYKAPVTETNNGQYTNNAVDFVGGYIIKENYPGTTSSEHTDKANAVTGAVTYTATPRPGFYVVGWFKDLNCTIPVNADWMESKYDQENDPDKKFPISISLTPPIDENGIEGEHTFYAKYDYVGYNLNITSSKNCQVNIKATLLDNTLALDRTYDNSKNSEITLTVPDGQCIITITRTDTPSSVQADDTAAVTDTLQTSELTQSVLDVASIGCFFPVAFIFTNQLYYSKKFKKDEE